jgi:DNA-binding transcriptional ArsR family regulator
MPNHTAARLDRVFHALADPTRRSVLEQLSGGPASMTELARPFRMALPSFSQHLHVLEDCGLVRSRKKGRVRTYQLAPKPLEAAEHWLSKQRTIWERRLDQLDDYLMQMKKEQKK